MKIQWDFSELTEFANNLSTTSRLDLELKRATKEIAHELLKRIKKHTPIGDTWALINGWDKNDFAVYQTATGFEVLLINPTEYATWVNDGHRQRPGRFIPGHFINNRFYYDPTAKGGMVLRKPFVKGRLFVEKGILEMGNTTLVESIILKHLEKWWESV
jgi:hypothetical protein